MPQLTVASDLALHYEEYDYADPWAEHGTFLLLHGFAESAAVWFGWVPQLARSHRVLAPDLRGFGRSSVPADPLGYPWSAAGFAADIAGLLDGLDTGPVHVVGARIGAAVGMQLAADRPDLVASLSLVSGLARGEDVHGLAAGDEVVPIDEFAQRIRSEGLASWFARTGRARLGSTAPEAQVAFWNDLMAGSDEEVCIAMMRAARRLDLFAVLGRIRAPTLVIASQHSAVQTVVATRDWQCQIPGSELLVLPGDSPHLAATAPDRCVAEVLNFVGALSPDRVDG